MLCVASISASSSSTSRGTGHGSGLDFMATSAISGVEELHPRGKIDMHTVEMITSLHSAHTAALHGEYVQRAREMFVQIIMSR